jgi:hypothetical protein
MGISVEDAYGGPAIIGPSSYLSSISSSGNNVYLLWSDYSPSEKVYHVFFRASNDAGKSFGHIMSMGNSFTGPTYSQMASHGNNLYIALINSLKKSEDGGHTFGDMVPVGSGNLGISNVIATENYVYLIEDNITNSGNGFEILFVASKDNGTTFGKPVKLFGMPESSEDYSQVAASGSNVYVVGEGRYGGPQGPVGVLYRASRDGGITFSDMVDLSDNNSVDYAPKIATDGNYVYVAWSELSSDHKNTDLIFRVSSDSGETFGPKIKLNQDDNVSGTYSTDFIQLLAHDQMVYVKWWDVHFLSNGTEQDHLMFKRMPLGDATIGKTIELTGNNARPTDIGHDSVIAVGANNVYALWSEYSNLPSSQVSLILRASQDGGFSFGDAVDLNSKYNPNSGMSSAQIVTSENNLYVAGNNMSPSLGILFGASSDGGKTFSFTNVDAEAIPEFPLAQVMIVISTASMVLFYRMRFRK